MRGWKIICHPSWGYSSSLTASVDVKSHLNTLLHPSTAQHMYVKIQL